MVAGPELGDFRSDRLYHSGAVGHRDASIGGWQPSRHDTEVVEVQRGRIHPHTDRVRSRITGIEEVH